MPRPAKGVRLYLRKRKGRIAKWVILDRGKEIATGCDESDSRQAEKALVDYLARKYESPQGACHPDQMICGRALEIYGNERAPSLASPETVGYHIEALEPFWGDLPVSAIKGETCRAYVRWRQKPRPGKDGRARRPVTAATARRELETLGAAVNYCHREGYLIYAPRVTLPPKATPKERWLTRSEAARLLLAAWRMRQHSPHLWVFILIGLYTGTRSTSILKLQWLPNTQGGWIDLERGILYRGAQARIETNKRQPPCQLPAKLLAHLRRVRQQTNQYVIEYGGRGRKRSGRHEPKRHPVKKLRRSWRTACQTAGLGSDVTPHTLRHTSVTWRLLKGIQLRDVAEYVGMSEKTCRDTYGHHCPDHLKEARDAF